MAEVLTDNLLPATGLIPSERKSLRSWEPEADRSYPHAVRKTSKQRRRWRQWRKAIYLLSALDMSPAEVAAEVGVKPRTLAKWLRDPEFVRRLDEAYERLEKYDHRQRGDELNKMSSRLMAEIHRRLADERELADLSLPSLMKMLKDLNFELRLDKGEATKRDAIDIEELAERFSKSVSSVYSREKPGLSLVKPPRLMEGEVVDGEWQDYEEPDDD